MIVVVATTTTICDQITNLRSADIESSNQMLFAEQKIIRIGSAVAKLQPVIELHFAVYGAALRILIRNSLDLLLNPVACRHSPLASRHS